MDLSHPIRSVMPMLDGEIYSVLAHTDRPLSGSKIAELVQRGSNPGVRRALARLVADGVVLVDQIGPSLQYRANRSHIMWPALEKLVLSAEGARSDLYSRISDLVDEIGGDQVSVSVFGSVARLTSSPTSDIDLVTVFPDSFDSESAADVTDSIAEKVFSWTGNVCNIYSITRADLGRMTFDKDPIIQSWKSDAVTIHGPEVRHLMSSPVA